MAREIKFGSLMEVQVFKYFREFYLLPKIQHRIGTFYADFAFPEEKIVVEYDGKEFHQDKEKDDRRDIYMEKLGWRVIRIKHARRLYEQVRVIANEIRALRGKLPIMDEDDSGWCYYEEDGFKMYS